MTRRASGLVSPGQVAGNLNFGHFAIVKDQAMGRFWGAFFGPYGAAASCKAQTPSSPSAISVSCRDRISGCIRLTKLGLPTTRLSVQDGSRQTCSRASASARVPPPAGVHVVGRQAIIQKPQFMLLQSSAQPGPVCISVGRELKKERPVMAAVRQMEHAATSRQTMGP